MMNSKRGFKRITFVLEVVAALSGTLIGVIAVIADYESAKAAASYGGYYILPDIENQVELGSDLPSTQSLVGSCIAAGLVGAFVGFSFTWIVIWFSGLAIYKLFRWLILGFFDDENNKQVEIIKAE